MTGRDANARSDSPPLIILEKQLLYMNPSVFPNVRFILLPRTKTHKLSAQHADSLAEFNFITCSRIYGIDLLQSCKVRSL